MVRRLPWGTLRVRLAIWNSLVVLAMTVAATAAARLAAQATLSKAVDDELRGGVREVALSVHDLYPEMDAIVAEVRRKAFSQQQRGWFVHLLTEEGQTLWQSDSCPAEVAAFPPFNFDRNENIVQIGPYRYVRDRIDLPGAPLIHVRVGTYTTGLEASITGMTRVLVGVGGFVCLLTPLIGWWLAVRATQPVAEILATADRLDPVRLTDRLPVRGANDELDHLAQTINRLLDDVAGHVGRQHDFVTDAAHELRSPLAAMQGTIEVAISQDRPADDYHESLVIVLDEARSLAKLANDLLLLAETGSNVVPLPGSPVDLAGIARQSVAMFAPVGEERGIDIRLDASDAADASSVVGDAAQLQRVVSNLLDNAIRSTPRGGIEVAIHREPGTGRATLTVTDTGRGIAAEHLPRLFDRFYKVDPARSRDGASRSGGLGLPICKAIVERHGGTIAISSRPGLGTTVTVSLPVGHFARVETGGVPIRTARRAAAEVSVAPSVRGRPGRPPVTAPGASPGP